MREAAPVTKSTMSSGPELTCLRLVERKRGPELISAMSELTTHLRAPPSRRHFLAKLGAREVWPRLQLRRMMSINTLVTLVAHPKDLEFAHGGFAELRIHLCLKELLLRRGGSHRWIHRGNPHAGGVGPRTSCHRHLTSRREGRNRYLSRPSSRR